MAFFTRVNLNVPVLPPEDSSSGELSVHHRRHASEPAGGQAASQRASIHSIREIATSVLPRPATNAVHRSNVVNTSTLTNGPETRDTAVCTNSATTMENAKQQTTNHESASDKPVDDNGEPKRYEYVVDRVLGVEV